MKNTILAIIAAAVLIVLALVLTSSGGSNIKQNTDTPAEVASVNNVSIVDGKQIIEIQAKGGYTPRKSIAKAGIPTILRMNTKGTFDCSSSIRIPSMNLFKSLPQSGVTDIDLGTQSAGTLNGSCGMGMYPFEIDFQ
ncbi:MAG: cupredoxin domain-containing protein [Candidatus Nomurabacteria bacterium]|nr:cupredoxin domain-containing protein [Candidatus Nomurabacteria bacterium]